MPRLPEDLAKVERGPLIALYTRPRINRSDNSSSRKERKGGQSVQGRENTRKHKQVAIPDHNHRSDIHAACSRGIGNANDRITRRTVCH
jgi:hypothetical protein